MASFLDGAPVTQLRGLAFLALVESGRVGAGSVTGDSGGGGVTVWTFGTAVPCRVDPLTGDEAIHASRLDPRSKYLITAAPGTVVSAANRFMVTGRATYEVTAVQDRTGESLVFFEAVTVS